MKRFLRFSVFAVFSLAIASLVSAKPFVFSDDFNGGLSNGWLFVTNPHGVYGNWRVENGVLAQDAPGDAFAALIEDFPSINQQIQTDVWLNGPAGYGGVTTWYTDIANWTAVFVYPAGGGVWVLDTADGITVDTRYPFLFSESAWYRLGVVADGQSNKLSVYVNGSFAFEHALSPRERAGLSGLYSGNSGGYFDNVELRVQPGRSKKAK